MFNKEDVLNFIENIKISDKISLVFHDDLDGFASGILMYDYLVKKGCENLQIFSLKIETDAFENILDKIKDSDKIIIMDLGPNLIVNGLNKLKDKKILYIDHHQNDVIIPESDLECLTLLALNGESELTSFCNAACNEEQKDRDSDLEFEKEIFKSPQCVRNSINRIENKNLIVKTGKGRKKIYVNPEMKLQTSGNIFVNVKLLRKEYESQEG